LDKTKTPILHRLYFSFPLRYLALLLLYPVIVALEPLSRLTNSWVRIEFMTVSVILVLLLCVTCLSILKNRFGAGNHLRHSLKNAALLGPFLAMSLTLGFFIYDGQSFCALGLVGDDYKAYYNAPHRKYPWVFRYTQYSPPID
jgi:hypothetical protein